ncbi:MAG: SPOR domain-containing protein [Flavobacteriales bacterium]|nr:SPOR domain-containing protein [Flavobacteriales bacterium]
MFYRIYTYRLVLLFGLLGSFQYSYAQSESQLLKKSNSFFSKADYRNAVNGYRQLLSNDIKNIDYNFKYAVCLFYTKSPSSSQKYFDYLLNQEGFPIDVFYFKGRLYHLNYQFERAIEMYEDYVKIKTSKNKDYHCLDEIKRCQNAISLLKSPRAIEVISMQKMSQENYFSSYVFDSENFKLYSNSDVFSKMNQKKGFVPKYVFKRGMKYRFFSSYSKLESAKKDIFIQQKDSNNEWKEPVRLGPEINSSFNEDFPFFDETSGYLYFSSDGHSSIGGMDVFRVRFNLKNLSFGTIENLNFPYSSTYDDFLYIPIESASYVYFTTNRNSNIGFVEVVKSKLSDREVPTFVSRLVFRDEVNDENTSAQFYLTNRMSKDEFGPFNTNDSGFVNILIPAPGIYKLTAAIEGSDQEFAHDINFPPKVEGYDYQVECSYKLQGSKEILLFDEQLTDQSSLLSEVNVIDFQEFSKLIVNSESIKANEENEVKNENKEVEELSQEAIDAKIDELYDIEAEIEDQIRQKRQVAKNIVTAKTTLASIDKKINRIVENIESADSNEKESLQKELRDSFVKRKALINNYNQQIELYDNFRSDEELENDYIEIANINKDVSEKSFAGQTDSVRSILTAYNTPENYKPLIPSVPDMARASQDKMEDDFKTTETNIDILKSEILEEMSSIVELKDQMSEVSSLQDWESLKDSVKQIETKVSNKVKEKQGLELEREELSEKIIFSEESLLNLTLIETGINEQDSIDIKDFTITEEEQVKFYADEIYINKVIDEQQVLTEISDGREESLSQISSTNLPIEVKDSLALITENEFIELINLKVDETLTESNDELNELIQLSQNNIEEIVEKNQELTSTTTERNESTEEENTSESNTNTENNTEELNTRSSEEERSTETLAVRNESTEEENTSESNTNTENNTEELNTRSSEEERSTESREDGVSNEVVDDLVQSNSKSVEYLTSLVLEESMGDASVGKSNNIEEIELNETDLKEYFKKELDIAIANEKIEYKYVKLKSNFPDVKFEGKRNIEAQLRELKIKENDLKSRMKSASSNNVKSLIARLIDANKSKMELLEMELEELNEFDHEKLKIESVQTSAKSKAEIQRTNAYYTYVLGRDKIESENQLLEELLVKNEDVMLALDRSLRDNLNSNELTKEQSEKIKEMAEIQEAIAYLKQNIELNKSNIVQNDDAKSFEYLYQNRINPIVDSKSVKSIKNNTKQINEFTSVLNVSLKQSKEIVQDFSPKSEAFKSYVEKRALLNLKTEELEQLNVNNSNVSTSQVEDSQIDGYLYVNEVKKDKISREIISIVNEMNSIDSSELFESYINNRISNNSLTSSTRLNQSILDVVPPNNSERNSFVVLEEKIIVENKATLPILETNPSGLNFRVQVGAFRRPVREDVYREFTPVSGQQLNNGLIVYMAGYFNNSNDAVSAQKSIRSIGYSDAFIVSYCNDERLPYWKGKEYERNGECLASARNEPIAINSSNENNNSDVNSKGNGVSNESEVNTTILSEKDNSSQENVMTSINSNIEQHGNNVVRTINVKGLFYSVQVGAFNRKIRGSELSQIEELNYYLASGLYRYSSGKFDSIEKARDRQKAVVSLGISDAFIVAYYNGERISIQKSRNLITENGNAILFDKEIQSVLNGSIQDNESVDNNQSMNSKQEITQVSRPIEIPIIRVEEEVEKIKMVSYTFNSDSFEEGTIERLNRIGVFNYNENDANITSSIINTSELTPIMSFYMKGMEENEFISEEFIEYRIELGNKIPGKLANWILRSNKTVRFIVLEGVNHLIFYVNNEIEKTELRDELNELLK